MKKYGIIRARSHFSLLNGVSSCSALIGRAIHCEADAIALTDENNLYGAAHFFKRVAGSGLHPVLGMILSSLSRKPGRGRSSMENVVILVRDREGYANICELATLRNMRETFSIVDALRDRHRGLFVLVHKPLLAEELARFVDSRYLFLEILRPAVDPASERVLVETAGRLGIRTVASCDIYFAQPGLVDMHQLLLAIRENKRFDSTRDTASKHANGFIRSRSDFFDLFRDMPDAIETAAEICLECSCNPLKHSRVFPVVCKNPDTRLDHEVFAQARTIYGNLNGEVRVRLKKELALISRMNFSGYFLLVADIVRHASRLGSPVAGRGSGASSMVAYVLGITNVDPLRFNLPFERFLNIYRSDYPDLDVDFCWKMRPRIIEFVFRKYGRDRVSMISTHAKLRFRSAFRCVAKAFALDEKHVSRFLRASEIGIQPGHPCIPGNSDDPIRRIYDFSRRCEGVPHHLSVHCGGVVITPDRISSHVPLQKVSGGMIVTQYEKDAVESTGLVKLDLLGNRALSAVSESIRLTKETDDPLFEMKSVPETDSITALLLREGMTLGVGQLESPAMRRLLRQLAPACVTDLMKALALIRPGAASLGMKNVFIRRVRGIDLPPRGDPHLDGLLDTTYGVMLYEDDALLVTSALTGLTPDKADVFRRKVTKCRTDDERRTLSANFLEKCAKNLVSPELAADLWTQMAKFNSYSFCRAHAASYARLAWLNAFMKAHFPIQFWVAALNNNDGIYPKWVYIEEAKRTGIDILPPCVNRSTREFSIESEKIRVGLDSIRMLSARASDCIIEQRPFSDLHDFLARTRLHGIELGQLVKAGALDFAGIPRLELLRQAGAFQERPALNSRGRGRAAAPGIAALDGDRGYISFESARLHDEWDVLSLSTLKHPVAYMRSFLLRKGFVPSGFISRRLGKPIRLCGMVAASRTTRNRDGTDMCFMTLSDEDGLFEVVLLPEVYSSNRLMFLRRNTSVFWMEGRPECRYDAMAVNANRIGTLK